MIAVEHKAIPTLPDLLLRVRPREIGIHGVEEA